MNLSPICSRAIVFLLTLPLRLLLTPRNRDEEDSGRCFGAISSPLRNTGNGSSSIALCPGYRWQLCLSLSSASMSPSPPLSAGDLAPPSPALGSYAWPIPQPSVPVGAFVFPGPCPEGIPCIFLSCFMFHFRIPCRADPSPERPSPPRAYRSVAQISYTSQATWGEREGPRDPPGES